MKYILNRVLVNPCDVIIAVVYIGSHIDYQGSLVLMKFFQIS